MKRYTACLQPLDATLTPEKIKSKIERDILHGRAAFYRLGKASQTAPDKILLEIASELRPAEVLQYFREREESLPVRIEQLHWGWPITGVDKLLITGMAFDRYATVQPQSAENASYTYSHWERVRYIAHLTINIVVEISILLIVFTPLREYFFMEGRVFSSLNWIIVYAWGYLFFGIRIIPVPCVAYIRCAANFLEIKYGLPRRPQCLAWDEISQLELPLQQEFLQYAVVRSRRMALKFPTGMERSHQEATLIKTIIKRASLILAEERSNKLIYKRSDGAAE